ncbi:MAG TPA: hypothetical protein VFY26_19105, partial [Anaerolineales bacterium]|nr:hypothetical protein [Anaerolineales bacterium]
MSRFRPPPRGPLRSVFPRAFSTAASSARQQACKMDCRRFSSASETGSASFPGALSGAPKSVVA